WRAVDDRPREGDLEEDLRIGRPAAGDLGAAEGAALERIVEPFGDRPAKPLYEVAEIGARRRAFAEEREGRLVGEDEPAVRFEPGQRDRQAVEEAVGDKPREFVALERQDQEFAFLASGIEGQDPDGGAAAGEE